MRDFVENPLLAAEAASVLADMADELAAHPENSTLGDMRAFILTEVGRFLLTHPFEFEEFVRLKFPRDKPPEETAE